MFLQQLQELYPLHSGSDLLSQNTNSNRYAGVILMLSKADTGYDLLFTKRAEHLNSHPGQVAFPGGKYELEDSDLAQTALRETEEEVGIAREEIELLGSMKLYTAKNGILVKPFLATTTFTGFYPSDSEIESLFHVPLDFFLDAEPSRVDQLQRFGRLWEVPAWQFDGYEIWGMTAMIVADFLDQVRKLPLEWRA